MILDAALSKLSRLDFREAASDCDPGAAAAAPGATRPDGGPRVRRLLPRLLTTKNSSGSFPDAASYGPTFALAYVVCPSSRVTTISLNQAVRTWCKQL